VCDEIYSSFSSFIQIRKFAVHLIYNHFKVATSTRNKYIYEQIVNTNTETFSFVTTIKEYMFANNSIRSPPFDGIEKKYTLILIENVIKRGL